MTSPARTADAGRRPGALVEVLAWVAVAAWTTWWAVRQADPSGISWHYFHDGAARLFGGSGLHLYADDPTLQIGPLAFVVAGGLTVVAGGHSLGAAQVVMTALLAVVVGAVTRPLTGRERTLGVLTVGLVLAPAWTTLTVRWAHLDDALALCLIALVVWAVRADPSGPGRPVLAAGAAGLAAAAKPWAVLVLPLLLLLPPRVRWRALGYAVLVTALAWLPFVIADPGTLGAFHPRVGTSDSSILWWLGYHGATLPVWDRTAQLVAAPLVSLLAVARGRWAGALLAGVAVRLALDPQNIAYYAAGAVLGALVLDLHGRRWRLPWAGLVTLLLFWQPFVADFARRFELATGPALWWYRHPGVVAGAHAGWVLAALVAAFWPVSAPRSGPRTARADRADRADPSAPRSADPGGPWAAGPSRAPRPGPG